MELSAAAAKRSLDLATLQYQEGIADFTTVLVASQPAAGAGLVRGQPGNIPTSLINTYRALGGGWEIREIGQELVPAQVREAMQKRTDWGVSLTPGAPSAASQQPPEAYLPAPSW